MKINKDINSDYKQSKIKSKSNLNKGSESEDLKSAEQQKIKELLIEGYKKEKFDLTDWDTTVSDGWN